MQPAQLVQDFRVARIILEQRAQREDRDVRPASRHGRLLQDEIGLPVVGLLLQNLFNHLDCMRRILFHLALRFHHRDRRRRKIEPAFFGRFVLAHLRAAQQLPPSQELGFFAQNVLEERNGVAEIAQLDRRHRFEPVTAQHIAEFLLCLNRHTQAASGADYSFRNPCRHRIFWGTKRPGQSGSPLSDRINYRKCLAAR